MSLHPRRRTLGFPIGTILWLTVVWELLWGGLTIANILAGLAIAIVVTKLTPMPPVEFHGRIHPLPLLFLLYRFVIDLVVASAQVAWQALAPGRVPRGAVLGVQLRSHSDLYLTLTAELCSLVPGSIVVEAHRTTGMLYVHVLDVELSGGIDRARHHVLDTEARILRAIASDAELAEAGLTRSGRTPRTAVAEHAPEVTR